MLENIKQIININLVSFFMKLQNISQQTLLVHIIKVTHMGNDMICGCIQRDNQAEKSIDAQHPPPAIYSDRILHLDGQNFANHPHKALYNKLANRRTLKNAEPYKSTKIIELTLNNQKGLYIGQYANNKPQGEGKLYMQNGDYYDGRFVNGQFTGHQAMIIIGYGSYYYGDVQKFLPNGNGEKVIQGLCFQVGKFIDGKLNGKGQKHDLLDKSQYKGFFKDGKKNGKGLLKKNQNEYYEGYFKEDIRQGLGHQKTLDYHYWGPFLNNEKSGKGTLKFNNGKKFEGYFKADKPNGYGELHYPNGDVKKGQFYSMQQLQN